jgi:hypothetical protein
VSPSGQPVLTRRQLNRATLARQLLLERTPLDAVAAIEQVGGLQAQEAASPYLALWARLRDFDPVMLGAAFRDRQVVKATLMRVTVHAVSRRDYLHLLPAVLPMLRGVRRSDMDGPAVAETERLAADALGWASRPRANVELRDRVGEAAWWRVRRHAPFLHVPSEAPWSFGRRPVLVGAPSWLGEPFAGESDAVVHLVRRYLGAFGPATAADAASWSGLPVGRLRPALAALDAVGEIERFADEGRRELFDLAGAPRPGGDVEAPPRLLPMWDSLLLAHADRRRVLADEHRPLVIARNGDVAPTVLVDGEVAGLWWMEPDGPRHRLVVEPFLDWSPAVAVAVAAEGERLAAFLEPYEPAVFGRYRRSRARRSQEIAG